MLLLDYLYNIKSERQIENEIKVNLMDAFVMSKIDTVPLTDLHSQWEGIKFKAVDTDSRQVDQI
jgi:hypothetical protein